MHKYLNLKSNSKGVLLIEVLLTVTILAVGLTVIINSFLSSFRASVYSKDYALAANLLENKLHTLKQDGFIDSDFDNEGIFAPPFEKFRYHVKAQPVQSNDLESNLNEVTLSVIWASGHKDNKIAVTTYLFNLPDEK